MTRAAVLAFVAACGSPVRPALPVTPPPSPPPVTSPPSPSPSPVLPAPPVVRGDAPAGGIEAPHNGSIALVAATPDGKAALTADVSGGVRLWPALDGSQEPRVVALPEPHALAIGPRDGGYTAAVLDAAGGLYIASLDAQGRSRAHVSLAAEPMVRGIAMSSRGLVAWRADQTVVLLDGDGKTLAQLATGAGERIVTVAVSGTHAAALLERDGKRGVRRFDLAATTSWADFVEVTGQVGDLLAIAPSGTQLALRESEDTIIVDGSGRLVGRFAHVQASAFSFADDDHLVALHNGLQWIANAKHASAPRDTVIVQLATGGGRAISALNSDLVVATPTATQYLGYDVESPAFAQPAADGQLLIGLGAKFLLLDPTLRVASQPAFPVPGGAEVADLRWLGGDAWAIEASSPDDGKTSLELVAGGKAKVVAKGLTVAHLLMYEPSTKLLTLSLGSAPAVYRFDPKANDLTRIASVPGDAYVQTELVPVAPARAGGAQLLHVTLRDQTTVAWVTDPAHLDRASSKATFPGAIAGADSAGRAYGWETVGDRLMLVIYRDGKRLATLPADGPISLWPDPAGARLAMVGTQAVRLVGSDGKALWVKQLAGVSQALWLSDGGLAVISAAGIARLDPATGNVTTARCGWGFGAATQPHPPAARVEPVCSQLEAGD